MRGQARALGAERLLDDLDQDLLAFLQQIFDLRLRPVAAPAVAAARRGRPSPSSSSSSPRFELVELLQRVDDVRDVEEAVALEPEVDEGGLHAGEDFRDPALVDVADDAALPFALDEDFRDQVVFEDGHHRFVAVRGDDHLLGHSRTPQASGCSALGYQLAHAEDCEADPSSMMLKDLTSRSQFVNLRMRTLSTSPNPASVAIIDDPP